MKNKSPELARQLRKARRNAKLRQSDAAMQMGLSRTTIVAIEKGQRGVTDAEVKMFAELYAVDKNWLTSTTPSETLEDTIERYENFILSMVLRGQMSTGGAAELMRTDILEIRKRMIERYGDDWSDAADDEVLCYQKRVAAGEFDDLLAAVGWSRNKALKHVPSILGYKEIAP